MVKKWGTNKSILFYDLQACFGTLEHVFLFKFPPNVVAVNIRSLTLLENLYSYPVFCIPAQTLIGLTDFHFFIVLCPTKLFTTPVGRGCCYFAFLIPFVCWEITWVLCPQFTDIYLHIYLISYLYILRVGFSKNARILEIQHQ